MRQRLALWAALESTLRRTRMTTDPLFNRITFDPNMMGGMACIRGIRIPVSVIVGQIAAGLSPQEVLKEYDFLEPEDIEQALQYAAWLTRERIHVG